MNDSAPLQTPQEMRARAEAFRDSWPSVSEGKALARDVIALTEMLVGLSADVTRLTAIADAHKDANKRLVDEYEARLAAMTEYANACESQLGAAEAGVTRLEAEIRIREESQIPVIPRAAAQRLHAAEALEAELRSALITADWLITCYRDMARGVPVRCLAEASAAYDVACPAIPIEGGENV